jgi:hypothetical protein
LHCKFPIITYQLTCSRPSSLWRDDPSRRIEEESVWLAQLLRFLLSLFLTAEFSFLFLLFFQLLLFLLAQFLFLLLFPLQLLTFLLT